MNKIILAMMAIGLSSVSFGETKFGYASIIKDGYKVSGKTDPETPEEETEFLEDVPVRYVSVGSVSSYAIDESNSLWVSGYNSNGQLGINNTDSKTGWFDSGTKVNKIMGTNKSAFILDSNGKVKAAGSNEFGKLGIGTSATTNKTSWFEAIGLPSNIVEIQAGAQFSMALDSSGRIWTTGINDKGQLGLGVDSRLCSESLYSSICQTPSGNDAQSYLYSWVKSSTIEGKTIKRIAVGSSHAYAIDTTGRLWATGYNTNRQLGVLGFDETFSSTWLDTGLTNIKSISANASSGYAVDTSGSLYVVGFAGNGRLGEGTTTGYINEWTKVTGLPKIKQAIGGSEFAFILSEDGDVWATGNNSSGYLGLGDTTARSRWEKSNAISDVFSIMTNSAAYHVLALTKEGKVYGTGKNDGGRLGNKTTSPTYFSTWTLTDQPTIPPIE